MRLPLQLLVITSFCLSSAFGQGISVGKKAKDNSVEAQLAAFAIHEDFEINLFADESMGIANPVAMHWDERGRLWVLTTLTYAQMAPGEKANDALVILEDTDQDGKADKSTIFADGLEMPMGFALGYGGVYLGEGTDLLFLKDTDGDDRADSREVLLTGFGTGDTHQNISNFTWGPDGNLYFAQGLHCYSRVETPYGIVRGDTAGFWRFDPETLLLEPFCFPSLASQNPCGIAFDKTGAMFLKSNNRELIYVTPGLIPTTHQKNLVPVASIGSTPGKSMGGEYVDSPHLPDWIQNHILIAGYYAHRVTAFPLVKEGAGYAKVTPVEILSSSHSSFRPVEIRIGPDGAIYVADWFNPIIGHYQASLRHPDRDEEHGRIWRIKAKGRELQRPDQWPSYYPADSSDVVDRIPFIGWNDLDWVKWDEPMSRLDLILRAANSKQAEALPAALQVLDHPRDRFIDYAMEQAIHALAPQWVPAVQSGKLAFRKPDHLAYALETLGGDSAMQIAKAELQREGLSEEAKTSHAIVIARRGSPEDLRELLSDFGNSAPVIAALADSWQTRKVKPPSDDGETLASLCRSKDDQVRRSAIYLVGAWGVKSLSPMLKGFVKDVDLPATVRGEAAIALARIEKKKASGFLLAQLAEAPTGLRSFLVAALVPIEPEQTAEIVAPVLKSKEGKETAALLISPFLTRKGGAEILAEAIRSQEFSREEAEWVAGSLSRMGRNEPVLLGVLQDAMGVATGNRAYSPVFVKKFSAEVGEAGNAESGEAIYQRAELTCVACHQLNGVGGIIGPSLDAVGAGLSTDLLIESVLWPQRQMKEGYFAVAVTTKGGDTFSGYREKEENGIFYLRDTATGKVREILRVEIAKLDNIGSLMPPGLTNGLSREELRDLIAYLASLKG